LVILEGCPSCPRQGGSNGWKWISGRERLGEIVSEDFPPVLNSGSGVVAAL
jgi:hypothetical protein